MHSSIKALLLVATTISSVVSAVVPVLTASPGVLEHLTLDDVTIHYNTPLGSGAFAHVYLGTCIATEERIAVKEFDIDALSHTLKHHAPTHEAALEFARNEARITHQLNHENIIKSSALSVDSSNNKAFLFLEYCQQGSLGDYMKKQRSLEQAEAQCYFYQMIQGLQHLHNHHIAHFDIKPANILLNAQGIVKIADMGHARSIPSTGKLLEKNYLGGTEKFMAPELLSLSPGSEFLAYQGDIWAAAVTYLHMKGCGDNMWRVARLTDPKYKTYWRDSSQLDFYCQGKLSMAESFVIHRMLNYSPQQRLTMDELIKDPWYQGLASKCH